MKEQIFRNPYFVIPKTETLHGFLNLLLKHIFSHDISIYFIKKFISTSVLFLHHHLFIQFNPYCWTSSLFLIFFFTVIKKATLNSLKTKSLNSFLVIFLGYGHHKALKCIYCQKPSMDDGYINCIPPKGTHYMRMPNRANWFSYYISESPLSSFLKTFF